MQFRNYFPLSFVLVYLCVRSADDVHELIGQADAPRVEAPGPRAAHARGRAVGLGATPVTGDRAAGCLFV